MTDKLTGDDLEKALADRNLPSEGTADEKRAAVAKHDEENGTSSTPSDPPTVTRLDTDVTKPSTTAPGDGPADTTDPTERATTVTPNPGDEALKVGTVNAVKPLPKAATPAKSKGKARTETYEVEAPDGSMVKVERNIETGESKRV